MRACMMRLASESKVKPLTLKALEDCFLDKALLSTSQRVSRQTHGHQTQK